MHMQACIMPQSSYTKSMPEKFTTHLTFQHSGSAPCCVSRVCNQVCAAAADVVCACLQLQYLECVDTMIRQLVARLHQAEADKLGQFAVCVTGDHSTPVLFGDHSHEPVPFTIAPLTAVVGGL